MKRNIGLKRRESRNLPPEKLRDTLSRIYPKEIVDELMLKFSDMEKQTNKTERGGEEE